MCLALAVGTCLLYWPVGSFDFITFDDPDYTFNNPHIQHGLTWHSFIWCFQAGYASNWHPLTWMTHILDWSLYGPKAGGHHLTNLALHIANTLLLFVVLKQMTGAFWRSAAVAALFAWHPMHVESVAWIAERKDVLCAFFFLLTLWAYGRYAKVRIQHSEFRLQNAEPTQHAPRRTQHATRNTHDAPRKTPHAPRPMHPVSILHSPSSVFYLLSLFFFALGLMAKQMLVTLPFVLLLLDWWPLRRFAQTRIGSALATPGWQTLLLEKVPFLALALGAGALTLMAQNRGGAGGAVLSLETFATGDRTINALVSYLSYIQKLFWPADLAVFYPLPQAPWPAAQVAVAVLCLAGISLLALWGRSTRPYLAFGWCWFLGTLVPVIGLVKVGLQSMADRYTYIPYIGLFVAICWACYEITSGWRYHRAVLVLASVAALAVLGAATHRQVQYWKNGGTLFSHTIAVTRDNYMSLHSLGDFYLTKGQLTNAQVQFEHALSIAPGYSPAQNDLGKTLSRLGKTNEARSHYLEALRLEPDSPEANYNLGDMVMAEGKTNEALQHYQTALAVAPHAARFFDIGNILSRQGKPTEAVEAYQQALRLNPALAEAHNNLACLLAALGQPAQAETHFREALRGQPNFADALSSYGNLLLQQGRIQEGIARLNEALKSDPNHADAHYNLGEALRAVGDRSGAVAQFRAVLRVKPDQVDALNNLAWLLATDSNPGNRDPAEGLRLAERACQQTTNQAPACLATLAAAYAGVGRFPEAIEAAKRACQLFLSADETNLARRAGEQLGFYQAGRPYREP
jgi:protein O-mannosyl-transferase